MLDSLRYLTPEASPMSDVWRAKGDLERDAAVELAIELVGDLPDRVGALADGVLAMNHFSDENEPDVGHNDLLEHWKAI